MNESSMNIIIFCSYKASFFWRSAPLSFFMFVIIAFIKKIMIKKNILFGNKTKIF